MLDRINVRRSWAWRHFRAISNFEIGEIASTKEIYWNNFWKEIRAFSSPFLYFRIFGMHLLQHYWNLPHLYQYFLGNFQKSRNFLIDNKMFHLSCYWIYQNPNRLYFEKFRRIYTQTMSPTDFEPYKFSII